jgi:hypothetical protein
MAHFSTSGKRYREGDVLPSFASVDLPTVAPHTPFVQTAPASLLDQANVTRMFLYWDTGRHITSKRTVHWTFNNPANWTEWRATAWYGIPGGSGPPNPTVTTDAHWVGVGPIDPTPIDGPGSTFVNGPGGTPVAWPWTGNDHLVRTEFGAANIHAKPHLQKSVSDPVLNFASWTQLVFGGDDTSFFSENDDDITSSVGTVTGVAATTSPFIAQPQNSGGLLLAGYAAPAPTKVDPGIIGKLIEVLANPSLITKFIDRGDPSPEDIIRLKLISESLDFVRGERPGAADAFEGLVGAARKMSAAELKRTIAGTKATLARGAAALKSIEALAKKAGK